MPRTKPQYDWGFTSGDALKGEPTNKRVTHKAGGKKFKESKPPISYPSTSQGKSDVNYGSHTDVAKQIGAEMRRLGL